LTVIKGEVGLMRLTGSIDDESIATIEREVDRLTRLVGDLLLLSQMESGRLELDMTEVELDTVLLEVFQQARVLAGDRLKIELAEIDQAQITGDRDRLKQVFLNLAANAVQYTPPGKTVTLGLRRQSNEIEVYVQDTGPGIPAKDLPHIFDRFYRAESSRKRDGGSGFGLGLSIAQWILKKHNGRIEVSSKEGEGTLFTVYLPIQPSVTRD
jgi:signal transduction histidine kinase